MTTYTNPDAAERAILDATGRKRVTMRLDPSCMAADGYEPPCRAIVVAGETWRIDWRDGRCVACCNGRYL